MISQFFSCVEFDDIKFDRSFQLFEFDTIRGEESPDLTTYTGEYKDCGRFGKLIDEFVRSKIKVVEVPTPRMLFPNSGIYRDCCISNFYDALNPEHLRSMVSDLMSHKILGIPYRDIAYGYYRAAWLPPPKLLHGLRPVTFHYPKAGYFGALAEVIGTVKTKQPRPDSLDCVNITITYIYAAPTIVASVLFVVAPSPIYRVTNQECCAGLATNGPCRLVVESRGPCDVISEMERLGICSDAEFHGETITPLVLPTIKNIEKNPALFCNTLNDQILKGLLDAKTQS